MARLGIDIGYSSTKIAFGDKLFKLPTAISFAVDLGLNYGEDEIYEFEGDKYRVGEVAIDESFTTTEYKFLYKFSPLIIYHVLNKLNLIQNGQVTQPIEIRTGLALTDWANKEAFIERIQNIVVNGSQIQVTPVLIPQGAGVYYDYINQTGMTPTSASVIDIGYNTINFLHFQNGAPIRAKCKSFPNHGVVSIIRPLTNWLESRYSMKFTEQESIKILLDGKFVFNGEEQEEVTNMVLDLKRNFVQKLFNSILVSEKKLLGLSEKVILAGGGSYFLKDVEFPKNTVLAGEPYEFSNVRGYVL